MKEGEQLPANNTGIELVEENEQAIASLLNRLTQFASEEFDQLTGVHETLAAALWLLPDHGEAAITTMANDSRAHVRLMSTPIAKEMAFAGQEWAEALLRQLFGDTDKQIQAEVNWIIDSWFEAFNDGHVSNQYDGSPYLPDETIVSRLIEGMARSGDDIQRTNARRYLERAAGAFVERQPWVREALLRYYRPGDSSEEGPQSIGQSDSLT